MRIVDIETFVTLVELRHFGKTAERLNTTQPAVSNRLANLERELKAQLVVRDERHFELTAEGEATLRCFQDMLGGLRSLRKDISHPNSEPVHVRIGAIDAVSSTILPVLVEQLRTAMPMLTIDLTIESTLALTQRLLDDELDIAFALEPVLHQDFQSFVACHYEMSWVGSPELIDARHRYGVEELAELPIVSFPEDSPPHRLVAPYFHQENLRPPVSISSNSLYAMINLIIDRFGVAPIPTVVVARELKAGLIHRLNASKPIPPMPVVVSYRASTQSDFMQQITRYAKDAAQTFCLSTDAKMAWT